MPLVLCHKIPCKRSETLSQDLEIYSHYRCIIARDNEAFHWSPHSVDDEMLHSEIESPMWEMIIQAWKCVKNNGNSLYFDRSIIRMDCHRHFSVCQLSSRSISCTDWFFCNSYFSLCEPKVFAAVTVGDVDQQILTTISARTWSTQLLYLQTLIIIFLIENYWTDKSKHLSSKQASVKQFHCRILGPRTPCRLNSFQHSNSATLSKLLSCIYHFDQYFACLLHINAILVLISSVILFFVSDWLLLFPRIGGI